MSADEQTTQPAKSCSDKIWKCLLLQSFGGAFRVYINGFNFGIFIVEDLTDDIANIFVEKGLLDDLYNALENKALYAKVGQVLAEVAKSG